MAPNMIMTSAHCFDDGDQVAVFRQNPRNGTKLMTGDNEQIPLHAQFRHPNYDERTCSPYDLAILVTRKRYRDYLPLAESLAKKGEKLFNLGYSGDLNEGFFLRVDYGCKVSTRRPDGFLRHNCATYGGNSGGPVIRAGPKIGVLGVHSCGVGDKSLRRTKDSAGAASVAEARTMYESITRMTKGLYANPIK